MALFSKKPVKGEKDVKKKTVKQESDGQEKYFKEDFDKYEKKPTRKKAAEPKAQAKPAKAKIPAEVKKEPKNTAASDKKTTAKAETKPAAKKEVPKPSTKTVKAEAKSTDRKAATAKKESPAKSTSKKEKPEQEKTTYKEYGEDSAVVKDSVAVNESRATANGKFDIRRAKDGRFFFSLYASNYTVIAYSQIYSSITSVNTGIGSVIANAPKAGIEDTTLKSTSSLTFPKWEIYIDRAGQYRFRLYASNGQCICHASHGYLTKSGCKGGIESIKRFSAEARVDKSYLK